MGQLRSTSHARFLNADNEPEKSTHTGETKETCGAFLHRTPKLAANLAEQATQQNATSLTGAADRLNLPDCQTALAEIRRVESKDYVTTFSIDQKNISTDGLRVTIVAARSHEEA